VDQSKLSEFGEVLTPSLEDLFVATNSGQRNHSEAAA